MKILVVCQYYYPENFQITPICEQLAMNGNDVTVLTGLPNYPLGIVPDEYKKGHRDEDINGVHVIRTFELGRKTGAFNLALNYISFLLSANKKIKTLDEDFDIVFAYQLSPVLMAIPGKRYCRKNKKPLLLYCCDLWPESMKMYIKSEKNILFYIAKRISSKIYSSCDKILTQSSSFVPYINSVHNIPKDKLMYLPAFADEEYLEADFEPDDDVIDFVFLGNIGIAQNLTSVLLAVEKIRDVENFKVHFVGDGSCLEVLKEFVQKKDLGNIVKFYGRRPVEEMPKYYKLADACLVSLKADNKTGLTLPAKVQGYMAAGKPIIGMINGSAKEVIEESRCGICVPADDIDGLANAMKDFIENREKYKDCGMLGREYFKANFRKNIFIDKLEKELKLLGGK